MSETVRIIRVLEYEGPKDWVERTLAKSIQGTYAIGRDCFIRSHIVEFDETGGPEESVYTYRCLCCRKVVQVHNVQSLPPGDEHCSHEFEEVLGEELTKPFPALNHFLQLARKGLSSGERKARTIAVCLVDNADKLDLKAIAGIGEWAKLAAEHPLEAFKMLRKELDNANTDSK